MTFLSFVQALPKSLKSTGDHIHTIAKDEKSLLQAILYNPTSDISEDSLLVVAWRKGGMDGGDCWGGEAQPWSSGVEAGEPVALDTLLEVVAPSISFLQYKKLLGMMKTDTVEDREYYGNSTTYGYKAIAVKDVHRFLIEHDLCDV